MAKMFVHYDGSVDNFKKIANYAKTYNNSIVFISGGENEEGAAIYTHGKFYANIKEVEDLAADLAALKIIKGVSVDGKNLRIAADHNGIIDFTSDDNSTVSVVGTSTGIKIGLNSAFVKRVTDAETAIAKEVEDRGKEITRVEGVVSGINGRVSAIEGTANDASSVNSIPGVKKYAVEKAEAAKSEAISDAEGKVNAAKAAVIGASGNASKADTIYGAKKYADEKAEAAKRAAENTAASDATSKANTAEQNAKNYADGLKNAIDAAYAKADDDTLQAAKDYADQAELDAIATAGTNADTKISAKIGALVGDEAGEADHVKVQVVTKGGQVDSVVVTTEDIASAATLAQVKADVDTFFKGALKDGAEQVKDTLKEIQDYINSDVEGAATMAGSIQDAKNAAAAAQGAADKAQGEVDALEDVVEGVKATADAAATKAALEAEIARADAAEKVNAAAIKVIADDYLVGQDRTDLEGMINGKVDKTTYAEEKAALQQADSNNLAAAKTYAEGLVNALDHEDVGTGNFVSKVEQTDGKVKVTYGTLPVDTLVTGTNNGTVKFNNTEVAVAGLKSAAYTEASAYATAAQGAKADAAAPQATTYTKAEVDAMWVWEEL